MTIRLHVERLTLEGMALNGAERARLEHAVVGELTRLLEQGQHSDRAQGMFAEGGAVAALRGVEARVPHGAPAATLGVEVARSVYGAMVPPPPRGEVKTLTPSGRR